MHETILSDQCNTGLCFISSSNDLIIRGYPGTSFQATASPGCQPIAVGTCRIQCSSSKKKQWPRLRNRSRQYLPASARSTRRSTIAASSLCALQSLAHRSARFCNIETYSPSPVVSASLSPMCATPLTSTGLPPFVAPSFSNTDEAIDTCLCASAATAGDNERALPSWTMCLLPSLLGPAECTGTLSFVTASTVLRRASARVGERCCTRAPPLAPCACDTSASADFCRDHGRFHSRTCLCRFSPWGRIVSNKTSRNVGRRKKQIDSACEQKARTSAGAAFLLSLPIT
mmetsp:Transcript_34383/g.83630  ORF Transcript_34383/g.83630 Transcript_34383/m.83630 type:complete len:287 (-) Transcript_34383:261-1121(-)